MIIFLILLFSVPMLAALGHDLYLFYLNPDKGFEFSAIGFIWTKYEPDSYLSVSQSMDAQTWEMINNILTYSAFYVGLGFAVFGYVIVGVAAFFMKKGESKHSAAAAANKWKSR